MSDLKVQIVDLEPLRVASFLGFGENTEELAWEKLLTWARPLGLLEDPEKHRLFGFNNPNPSPGSPNYGYEVWIELGDKEIDVEEGMEIKDFGGGLYAVARCVVPKGKFEVIGETWKKLVTWREDSMFRHAAHQWLEKHVDFESPNIEFVLDLYLPIAK